MYCSALVYALKVGIGLKLYNIHINAKFSLLELRPRAQWNHTRIQPNTRSMKLPTKSINFYGATPETKATGNQIFQITLHCNAYA